MICNSFVCDVDSNVTFGLTIVLGDAGGAPIKTLYDDLGSNEILVNIPVVGAEVLTASGAKAAGPDTKNAGRWIAPGELTST